MAKKRTQLVLSKDVSKLGSSGDLVEVAPGDDEWDGNVGARLLLELCGMLANNNGLDVGERLSF